MDPATIVVTLYVNLCPLLVLALLRPSLRMCRAEHLPLLFLVLRAYFATTICKLDASSVQDLGIASLIILYLESFYTRKEVPWIRELVIAGIASWHVYRYVTGFYRWDAVVSYLVLDLLAYLRFRKDPLSDYLAKVIFVELFVCDAREYVVLFYIDVKHHFPYTFFLHLRFPTPYAMIPCIAKHVDRRRLLSALIPILAIVNALHFHQLGRFIETGTRLDELAIRLATIVATLLTVRDARYSKR